MLFIVIIICILIIGAILEAIGGILSAIFETLGEVITHCLDVSEENRTLTNILGISAFIISLGILFYQYGLDAWFWKLCLAAITGLLSRIFLLPAFFTVIGLAIVGVIGTILFYLGSHLIKLMSTLKAFG